MTTNDFSDTIAAVALADDARLAALIGRIVVHDEQALARLYDETAARVWAVALRFAHDVALADEVVEEVYWQVWREAPRYDQARGRPLAWLLTIARSRAIDALRRERRVACPGGDDPHETGTDAADPEPQPPERLALAREQQRLHAALARLPAPERELVTLAFFRGFTHEEIVLRTALPLGTVKSRIRRALLTLRQSMSEAAAASDATV